MDFCTPRYVILREPEIEKFRVGWGMKVRKFEEKIREMEDSRLVKMYWKEKNLRRWKESYGLKKEEYYNRNGWGVIAVNGIAVKEERNLMKELRERDVMVQKQLK